MCFNCNVTKEFFDRNSKKFAGQINFKMIEKQEIL